MEHPGYVSVKYLGSIFPLFLSLFLSSLCRDSFRKKHLIHLGRTSRKKGHLGSDLENHLQMHEVTETWSQCGKAGGSRAATMCTGRMERWVKWGYKGPRPPASGRGCVQGSEEQLDIFTNAAIWSICYKTKRIDSSTVEGQLEADYVTLKKQCGQESGVSLPNLQRLAYPMSLETLSTLRAALKTPCNPHASSWHLSNRGNTGGGRTQVRSIWTPTK